VIKKWVAEALKRVFVFKGQVVSRERVAESEKRSRRRREQWRAENGQPLSAKILSLDVVDDHRFPFEEDPSRSFPVLPIFCSLISVFCPSLRSVFFILQFLVSFSSRTTLH
jgi:hypothetical protein